MSIAVELPPAMEHEAVEYASVRGTTLQQMFLDYLKRELDRTRAEGEIPGRALEESFRESEAMSSGDLPKQRFETVEELFAECRKVREQARVPCYEHHRRLGCRLS